MQFMSIYEHKLMLVNCYDVKIYCILQIGINLCDFDLIDLFTDRFCTN